MDTLNVYFKSIDDVTCGILQALREERYRNISYWFDTVDDKRINRIRDAHNIKVDGINNSICCYNWDISDVSIIQEYDGLKNLIWRSINNKMDFVCIDSTLPYNNQFVLFQDAKSLPEYPESFIKVPCFNSIESLMAYANSEGFLDFSLQTDDFEKYSSISNIQGALVYKENKTGYYWYMDMLHKTHYEVFDRTGKHLGEADLRGKLDRNKKDSDKTISIK